jgi:acyl-CoA reductase-like NAD-dependent aldehyde dehydrogenase
MRSLPRIRCRWSFQASIFAEDLGTAFDTVERLTASAVMVNDHTAFGTD